VLAFTGDAVKDDEVAGLLGLVDRELLHRATRAIVEGSSLTMLELVESLADYGADYRNFVRELLLHLREILLVKLAPPGSPLLAQILPEEAQELRAFADSLSEEDLLRGLDLLTRAEGELRNVTDPRVALDLVLLKLVQMRRLVPFAEVVARVERMLGGGASAPAASMAAPRALPDPRRAATPPPIVRAAPAAARSFVVASPAPIEEPRAPAAAGSAEAVLATMLSLSQSRPSLAAPLRAAVARQDGGTLVLELPPDFLTFAREHAEDYRALAKQAAGHALALRIDAGAAAASAALEQPSPETTKRQKLREEAEKEPAVQEALDLFDGRVVDVRET
jgi:DNA polymerase-3 subunit gamma/tau